MKKLLIILLLFSSSVYGGSATITSLPYTVSQASHSGDTWDTLYYVDTDTSTGNSLSASNHGITFGTGTHHWLLWMKHDSLMFGTDSTYRQSVYAGARGITFSSTSNNIVIKGGSVIHNPDNIPVADTFATTFVVTDTLNAYCIGIALSDADSVTLDSMEEISVRGIHNIAVSGGGAMVNNLMRGCDRVINYCYAFRKRSLFETVVVGIANLDTNLSTGDYNLRLEDCNIYSYSHVGLFFQNGGAGAPATSYGIVEVENCSLYIDMRNYWDRTVYAEQTDATEGAFTTNGYAIFLKGVQGQSFVKNNYIESGNSFRGGRGFMSIASNQSINDTLEIWNNRMVLHEGRSMEYDSCDYAPSGLKIRDNNRALDIYNNTITMSFDTTHDSVSAYLPQGECMVLQIWDWTPNYSNYYVTVRNNRCSTLSVSADADASEYNSYALKWDLWVNVNDPTSYSKNNFYYSEGKGVIDYGQYDGNADSTLSVGDTLVLSDTYINSANQVTFNLAGHTDNSEGNIILDAYYGTGTSPSSDGHVTDCGGTASATQEKELYIKSTLNISIKGNNELLVSNASCSLINNYGQSISTATAGGDGIHTDTLTNYVLYQVASDSTAFSPCSIIAWSGTDTTKAEFAFDWNNKDTTVTLLNTVGDVGQATTTNKKLRKIYIRKGKI